LGISHHATRADIETYSNSHQIGAAVAQSFAVVSEDWPRLHGVKFEGQGCRGAEPITEHLIAFPVISNTGHFGLVAPDDDEVQKLVDFIAQQPNQQCFKELIKKRKGHSHDNNLKLLKFAIDRNLLFQKIEGKNTKITTKTCVPDGRDASPDLFASPISRTAGDA